MTIPVQCPSCGFDGNLPSALIGKDVDCPKCKLSFVAGQASEQLGFTTSKPKKVIKAPAYKPDEVVFYKKYGVFVSNVRLRVDGQTYAMSGITSVKSWRKKPDVTHANIALLAGVGFVIFAMVVGSCAGANGSGIGIVMALGLVVLAIGFGFIARQQFKDARPRYCFAITTAGEEVQALVDDDEERIDDIVDAINEAILERG